MWMTLLIVLPLGFLGFVRYLEKALVFHPEKPIIFTPAQAGLPYEDVYFTTEDGVKLHGWLVRSRKSIENPVTMIFCHGNAGNIGDRVETIAGLTDIGLQVFIFDYRGYGHSQGTPGEDGLYRDARAAYDYLKARGDVDMQRIVLYGASLGGAVAVDLAGHRSFAALILASTFTSGRDMAGLVAPYVPKFMVNIKLDSIGKIRNLNMPKLMIHSPEDEMIPYRLGQRLFDAAPQPKHFLDIRGHHNEGYEVSHAIFLNGVREFLQRYGILPPAS